MVTLKYLSNFWRTLEISLVNCEININLTWSANRVFSEIKKAIRDTKLYVSVVTLPTQDNAELLQKLKSGFKRSIS